MSFLSISLLVRATIISKSYNLGVYVSRYYSHTISATLSLKDVFVVPGGEPRAGLKLPIMGHVQPLAVETVMVLSVIEFIQSKAAKNSPHQSLNAVKRNAQQALSVRPMESCGLARKRRINL
jgi:hypothetical protein